MVGIYVSNGITDEERAERRAQENAEEIADLHTQIADLSRDLTAARAQCDAFKADAERMDWADKRLYTIGEICLPGESPKPCRAWSIAAASGSLREAIDAMRAREGEIGNG